MTYFRRFSLAAPLLAAFTLQACNDDTAADTDGLDGPRPFADAWRTEADWPFDPGLVSELRVGGALTEDNYANRGDIQVYYTLDEDRIVVQMRRFTFAESQAQAEADFANLHAWMFDRATVARPDEILANDPQARCDFQASDGTVRPWAEGCSVRVYYEGQSQKLRVGADLRVYLPRRWRGHLAIETQDNIAERDDYPDRGDVEILDLAGSVEILVDAAEIYVRLAGNIDPAPACTAEQNQACAAVGWDLNSPQCTGCESFGRVRIETRGEQPVDITVDSPSGLWMNAILDNTQPGMTPGTDPLCQADIDCAAFGGCDWIENDTLKPWRRRVELNPPGAALAGAGYNLSLVSGACAEIQVADGPTAFMAPRFEKRGDVRLCSGCLEDLAAPSP